MEGIKRKLSLRMVAITGACLKIRCYTEAAMQTFNNLRESLQNFNGERHEEIAHFLKKNEADSSFPVIIILFEKKSLLWNNSYIF